MQTDHTLQPASQLAGNKTGVDAELHCQENNVIS
jgi:hypothetical protein